MKHQPRKRFGQNFLVDPLVIASIVAAIHPARGEHLIEIGPGLGALTRPLLAAAGQLRAIEIDRDLAAGLTRDFGAGLILHVTDVLRFDFGTLGDGLRVKVLSLEQLIETKAAVGRPKDLLALEDLRPLLEEVRKRTSRDG